MAPTSWRRYIPSRGWLIFLGITSSIASAALYDKYQLKIVREDLKKRASQLAAMPMDTRETPRKVLVYLAPSQWATYSFKEFVKPVFDAAALDYEILEPSKPHIVRKAMRELIWRGKEEQIEREEKYRQAVLAAPKTWFGGRIPVELEEEDNPVLAHSYRYSSRRALVAVGPEAWGELLAGLEEGSLSTRPPPKELTETELEPAETAADASLSEADRKKKETERQQERQRREEQESLHPQLELAQSNLPPQFAFPIISFVPGKNLTGFKNFPMRIAGWFNQRATAKEVGEEALKIVFEKTRAFDSDRDYYLGHEHLPQDQWPSKPDPVIAERLSVYA
ncbi:mitochondrial import inner membrane translocase subunit Tim54 [Polychytrium aggregatum]|uniref:mitochondrial import inner membrane translocase subunit Tim54 n=1 Tax=Polychytrium aggregatum TaxID=110093 RepID=UPI0022FEB6EC|nr:mitochondrial import inner membrane translocase subunit Tim54 [Polychytrium aggregatum]KAI9192967.1 mitochondrial import inner membrane translocase subunit Tim54 [Polychytrium aggregatum]